MRDVNKGLFGLYNYKGSVLEITAKDKLPKVYLKAFTQGFLDGCMVTGIIVFGASLYAVKKNKN